MRTEKPLEIPAFESLVHMLERRAAAQPDAVALRFLNDGEKDIDAWTYAELAARARGIAARLREVTSPGDRVLLLYPPGLEYIAAFYGCLYAGALAVPAYPPDPSNLARTAPRLHAMIADCGARLAMTTSAIADFARTVFGSEHHDGRPALEWLASDAIPPENEPGLDAGRIGSIAFLQYTSGSTAAPRGVMVSHDNLLENFRAIVTTGAIDVGGTSVTWLPPYHDMGLIGGILSPVYFGGVATLMSPLHFLQRPLRWLQAISDHRGAYSAAPNFAYELCVRKSTPEQRARLDLSSWTTAFNGAEPISAGTLARFVEAFGPRGFRGESFVPCYGLAESTLIVTGKRAGLPNVIDQFSASSLLRGAAVAVDAESPDARVLVSTGEAIAGHQVRVVDPHTRRVCEPAVVGELWVRGPCVAAGYWGRDEESAAVFGARLDGGDEGPHLRTGDLGFARDGQIFVTGRIKDLIIIAGQNHYPQDLERTAEGCHPALRPGTSAAFALDVAGEERAAVVVELDAQADDAAMDAIRSAVVAAVAREHRLSLYAVFVTPRRSVPRTSSGKVQRGACRTALLDGTLEVLAGAEHIRAATVRAR